MIMSGAGQIAGQNPQNNLVFRYFRYLVVCVLFKGKRVPRLSTFVFKKSSEKKIFTIIFVVKELKGFWLE